jgi:ribosomal protein S18 acetylase RimI-like enzyme
VAATLAPHARLMLASEENEPGHGWDYRRLQTLASNPSSSATTLGQVLLILRLVLTRGLKVIPRLQAVQETMEKYHPREPHYYLQSIGARQDCQGQGVGSALLKQVTPLCDADQLPAYLESSNAANVALYERHGFEVVNEERIGDDGPPMWFMLRPPR